MCLFVFIYVFILGFKWCLTILLTYRRPYYTGTCQIHIHMYILNYKIQTKMLTVKAFFI